MTILETNNFQKELENFIGTTQYFYQMPFTKFFYTAGVKHFFENAGKNGAYWLFLIIATEIYANKKFTPQFYFIELQVNKDNTAEITMRLDKDMPVIYRKKIKTDIEPSKTPYRFFYSQYKEQTVLMLPNEY